jgi:hypothetical protein
MRGEVLLVTAIVAPSWENVTRSVVALKTMLGSANLVPNPDPLHGYAMMCGALSRVIAISVPAGLKSTPKPPLIPQLNA